ncbi:hypothetical protein KKD19_03565 [Patescibacteria group bacterium]|nr:hypothetical protein [Patescibacteria group bacterium]MBU4512292.1 hypothetical protein [Patescibacteria group bacterium]MCG2693646.1 hypothetical protein [Candidatus Parcubacteria bacterium]
MFEQKPGTILLLSLLILTGILLTSGIIATIVLQHLQMSRNIDNSILAFYAAEAGIEQGLYTLRKIGGTINDVKKTETLGNGASYDTDNAETALSENVIKIGIPKNQTFQINLYNPDNSLLDSGIRSIVLYEVGGSGFEWAEVSWVTWDSTGDWGAHQAKTHIFSHSQLTSGSGVPVNLSGIAYAYRVRIKALYDDLEDLEIRAYSGADGGGSQVPIPGRVVIKSVGEYGTSKQALKVSYSSEAPIYGLYDYVIFSEESLIK